MLDTVYPSRHKPTADDEQAEDAEFWRLVADFRPRGFTHSIQVSRYITDNKIGYKYPRIAGNLDFENASGDEWTLKGGIAPRWFRRLCEELRVRDKCTDSRVKRFTAHRDLQSSEW